jgi:hypothetical protein
MKRQLNTIRFFLAAAFLVMGMQEMSAQCDSWEKHPQGKDEALKIHSLYRDKFKEKKYEEAFPLWEEVFKYVQVPEGAKKRHFEDGIVMYVYFAKNEKDKAKKKEYLDKMNALYEQMAKCTGEDASDLGWQGYYLYANGYGYSESYKIFEKSLDLGKDAPPPMIMAYMSSIAIYFNKNKTAGFDDQYLLNLYERLKTICEKNKSSKDAASYAKNWIEVEKQFASAAHIFGCEYWVAKLQPESKKYWQNADSLKTMASKLSEKCGKDNELYKEIYKQYRTLMIDVEKIRQGEILKSDTATVYSKILAYRILAEIDTANAADYKSKESALMPEFANSSKEWVDNKTRGEDIYRYAFLLYREGNFSAARNYCRITSKFLPNWGDPYILVGTMYASSGPRCSADGTGFDAQICVWPAIDEWSRAKSIDPSVAEEANRLIGKYSIFMPTKTELAQRGINPGTSYTIPCWIQVTTTARGI